MKTVKKNNKVEVSPPKGYHWMTERGRYYLMEGEYNSHPGSIEKASFKTTPNSKREENKTT